MMAAKRTYEIQTSQSLWNRASLEAVAKGTTRKDEVKSFKKKEVLEVRSQLEEIRYVAHEDEHGGLS